MSIQQPNPKNNKPFILRLDEWEATAVEIVVKLMTWLMPAFTMILLAHALAGILGLDPLSAWFGAAVIELIGLGFMHTAMTYFHAWRGRLTDQVNFYLTAGCVVAYAVTAFTIALVIKLPGDWSLVGKTLVPALAVILSMLSALVGSVRASTYKTALLKTGLPQPVTRSPRTLSLPKVDPVNNQPDDPVTHTLADLAHQSDQAGYERVTHLRAEGLTWSQIATNLNISESTAKRWAKQAAPRRSMNGVSK